MDRQTPDLTEGVPWPVLPVLQVVLAAVTWPSVVAHLVVLEPARSRQQSHRILSVGFRAKVLDKRVGEVASSRTLPQRGVEMRVGTSLRLPPLEAKAPPPAGTSDRTPCPLPPSDRSNDGFERFSETALVQPTTQAGTQKHGNGRSWSDLQVINADMVWVRLHRRSQRLLPRFDRLRNDRGLKHINASRPTHNKMKTQALRRRLFVFRDCGERRAWCGSPEMRSRPHVRTPDEDTNFMAFSPSSTLCARPAAGAEARELGRLSSLDADGSRRALCRFP